MLFQMGRLQFSPWNTWSSLKSQPDLSTYRHEDRELSMPKPSSAGSRSEPRQSTNYRVAGPNGLVAMPPPDRDILRGQEWANHRAYDMGIYDVCMCMCVYDCIIYEKYMSIQSCTISIYLYIMDLFWIQTGLPSDFLRWFCWVLISLALRDLLISQHNFNLPTFNGCGIVFGIFVCLRFWIFLCHSFLVPFALYLQQFGTRTCHFAWYLLHFGMVTLHFAWYLLHLAMFAFHFAW